MIDLVVAAMLAHPLCLVDEMQARHVAQVAIVEERRHHLPSMLLVAVVLHESGGKKIISRHKHGCDVGPAQIFVRDCKPQRVKSLLLVENNLKTGAKILADSRYFCRKHPRWRACKRSKWALYNAGSPTWSASVMEVWREIRKHDTYSCNS